MASKEIKKNKKILKGIVVSDKMQKTVVVRVDWKVKHPFYKKFVSRSRRYKAHDENNLAKQGDLVSLVESRPISKDKRWALKEIIRKSGVGLQ